MNPVEALNTEIFLWINAPEGTPAGLITMAYAWTSYVLWVVPLGLGVMWLRGGAQRRCTVVQAICTALLGLCMSQLIRWGWPHPRPFVVPVGHTWMYHSAASSFPSDHMTALSSLGLVLLLAGEFWWAAVAWLVTLGVAWARVFLGVHFPLDMLGGLATAVFCYGLVSPVWERLGLRVTGWLVMPYQRIFAGLIRAGWVKA